MNQTKTIVATTKGMSKLVTARFGPGMLLQHEDLEQLNSYTRDLSRLMFRSFFGCGVVCGLDVKAVASGRMVKITVDAGLALACSGDPVNVPKEQTILLGEDCHEDIVSPLWVVLCGTTTSCAPRSAMCADDEAHAECTRVRNGFEIRVVRERPACACGCPDPTRKRLLLLPKKTTAIVLTRTRHAIKNTTTELADAKMNVPIANADASCLEDWI